MDDSIPRDVDMAYVEIGVRGAVDHRLESKAALAVLAIIAANPAVKVAVTVGGWDDDDRAVWEIPEARDCVRRFADRVSLERWPFEVVWHYFQEESIYALIKCEAWKPDQPVRLVEVPGGQVGHA
jgi:hypothetical protein